MLGFRFDMKPWFVAIFTLFSVFLVAEMLQVEYTFEDGVYGNFTSNLLQNGDFNLVSLENRPGYNWQVTETYQWPTLEYPTISTYLAPFFLYKNVVLESLDPRFSGRHAKDYLPVHVLSTVFFIFLGLIFYRETTRMLGVAHLWSALFLVGIGTSSFWYCWICSTSTDVFAMVYSIAGLLFFLRMASPLKNLELAFLGLVVGFGFALRVELLWLWALPFYLFFQDRANHKRVLSFTIAGALPPLACFAMYRYFHAKSFLPPSMIYLFDGDPIAFGPFKLMAEGFGPNGYLTLFPIWLVIGLSIAALTIKPGSNRSLFRWIFAVPILLTLAYTIAWPIMDGLQGRHQITYTFLYVIALGLALDEARKRSKYLYQGLLATSGVFALWGVYSQISYYGMDTSPEPWRYLYEYQLGISKFLNGLNSIQIQLRGAKWVEKIKEAILMMPLILGLAWLLVKSDKLVSGNAKRVLSIFFGIGAISWCAFNISNCYFNPKNVELYRQQGMFQNKVVGRGIELGVYDDKVQVYRYSLLYYLSRDRCDLAKRLHGMFAAYISRISNDILVDPIGLKEQLHSADPKASPIDDPWILKELSLRRNQCSTQ